eukprot:s211_g6.t1
MFPLVQSAVPESWPDLGRAYFLWQARDIRGIWGSETSFCVAGTRRTARFLSHVHFVWQAWDIRGIWRSETSFCVAGARRTALFKKCRRREAFCTLLKRWQAWLKMRGAFGALFSWQAQYSVNLDDAFKGSKVAFVKLSSVLILDMLISSGGRNTSMTSGPFSWQAQDFVDLDKKAAET